MSDALRSFNETGIETFSKWLSNGAVGGVPHDLLRDDSFSKSLGPADLRPDETFRDRYEFGCRLVELLPKEQASRAISYDRGLWTWLAAWYFEQICPAASDGRRALRKSYVYVLSNARLYYRHLVRTPWFLVSKHGENCRYLLASTADDPAPLSRQSYLLDQLAARQYVIASPTLVAAANRLYVNQRTGRPKRGAGAKGRGSPRRLALIANQLSLTFDIRDMPVDNFMKLLPEEFSTTW
jgi:hypothetical protein